MKATPKQILEKISQITAMERGTLCPMKRKNKTYYNHQTWKKGGNISRYVSSDLLPELKKAVEGYQLFQKLCQQYADLNTAKLRYFHRRIFFNFFVWRFYRGILGK